MTRAQNQMLVIIADFIQENGYAPSYKEIAVLSGRTSLSTIFKHVQSLMRHGYLYSVYNRGRSIELTAKAKRELEPKACPNCGFAISRHQRNPSEPQTGTTSA